MTGRDVVAFRVDWEGLFQPGSGSPRWQPRRGRRQWEDKFRVLYTTLFCRSTMSGGSRMMDEEDVQCDPERTGWKFSREVAHILFPDKIMSFSTISVFNFF